MPYKNKIARGSQALRVPDEFDSKKRPTILVVEDDITFITFYRLILARSGYRVLSARNGLFALALLKKEQLSPELILVDCMMPEMGGEDFLVKLKTQNPRVFSESKVVGLTSHDCQSPYFKRMKNLAFDCREKPSGVDELLKIVSDYI